MPKKVSAPAADVKPTQELHAQISASFGSFDMEFSKFSAKGTAAAARRARAALQQIMKTAKELRKAIQDEVNKTKNG